MKNKLCLPYAGFYARMLIQARTIVSGVSFIQPIPNPPLKKADNVDLVWVNKANGTWTIRLEKKQRRIWNTCLSTGRFNRCRASLFL